MHNVKPYQVRRQADGELHPVAITERLLAVRDKQYSSPVLLLREQPYLLDGTPTVAVTRVLAVSSPLTEVAPTAVVPIESFVVSYTEGIIYLNESEVPTGSDVSAALYIVEYSGLGTLVSTRDILSRDADASNASDTNSALQRFNVTDSYKLDPSSYTASAQTTADSVNDVFSFVLSGVYITVARNSTVSFMEMDRSTATLNAVAITSDAIPNLAASNPADICIISESATAIHDGLGGLHLFTLSGTSSGTARRLKVTSFKLGFTPIKLAVLSPGNDSIIVTYVMGNGTGAYSTGYLRLTSGLMLFDQVNIDISSHIDTGFIDILSVSSIQGPNTTFSILQSTGGTTVSVTSLYFNSYIYDAPAGEVIRTGTLPFSGNMYSFAAGYGPDGSVVVATFASFTMGPNLYTTAIHPDGECTTLTFPLMPNEQIVSTTRSHGLYIGVTRYLDGSDVHLRTALFDFANYEISPPLDINASVTIGPVAHRENLSVFTYEYGGFAQIIYYDNRTASNTKYVLDYARFDTKRDDCVHPDGLLQWEGDVISDETYIDDTTPGVQLTLLTTCKDTEIEANSAGTIEATVTGKQDVTGDVASFRVTATIHNDGMATTIVGTPTTTVLASTAGATGWVARAYNAGNYLIIFVHADGSTNNVHWSAEGFVVKTELPAVYTPGSLAVWEGETTTDETYVNDTTPGTKFTLVPASTVDTLASGEIANVSAVVTAASVSGEAASFRIEGTVQYDGSTTILIGTPTVSVLAASAAAVTWRARVYFDSNQIVIYGHGDGSGGDTITWNAKGILIKF